MVKHFPARVFRRAADPILLSLILLVGALLRFSHADWDGGHQLHPDERGILFVAQTIALPDSLSEALTPSRSPLNPFRTPEGERRDFAYGHLPLYVTTLARHLLDLPNDSLPGDSFLGRLLNTSAQPRFVHLTYVGRALSALYDTLTILAAWLLARELFNRRAARLAAAFTAVAVLHVQNAHFGTVDSMLSLFATLTLWLLTRHAKTGCRRDSLLAGLCFGLAVGSKTTAILLTVPILAAHLTLEKRPADHRGRFPAIRLADARTFGLTLLAALLVFAVTNPYALLDPVPFVRETTTQAMMTSGALDWPFTRQYARTLPLWYTIEQQARWTLGLPLTLAAYAGLIWMTRRTLTSCARPDAVALAWAGTMLLAVGLQYARFPRYALPLTPTLFVFAAGMLTIPQSTPQPARPALRTATALLILIPTTLYALAFTAMYRTPHPWITASRWIYRTLPPGTAIAVEYWDDPLPLDIVVDGTGYLRDSVYDTRMLDPLAEPDDADKLDALLSDVSEADFVIFSSNRLYGVIPRLDDRYPLTAAYYRALFAGDLGFTPVESFTRTPNLFGLALVDDPFTRPGLESPLTGTPPAISLGPADESFTVYDHPLVLVFHNDARLSADDLRTIVLAQVER
jgi:hypothetical protein